MLFVVDVPYNTYPPPIILEMFFMYFIPFMYDDTCTSLSHHLLHPCPHQNGSLWKTCFYVFYIFYTNNDFKSFHNHRVSPISSFMPCFFHDGPLLFSSGLPEYPPGNILCWISIINIWSYIIHIIYNIYMFHISYITNTPIKLHVLHLYYNRFTWNKKQEMMLYFIHLMFFIYHLTSMHFMYYIYSTRTDSSYDPAWRVSCRKAALSDNRKKGVKPHENNHDL